MGKKTINDLRGSTYPKEHHSASAHVHEDSKVTKGAASHKPIAKDASKATYTASHKPTIPRDTTDVGSEAPRKVNMLSMGTYFELEPEGAGDLILNQAGAIKLGKEMHSSYEGKGGINLSTLGKSGFFQDFDFGLTNLPSAGTILSDLRNLANQGMEYDYQNEYGQGMKNKPSGYALDSTKVIKYWMGGAYGSEEGLGSEEGSSRHRDSWDRHHDSWDRHRDSWARHRDRDWFYKHADK